MADSAGRTLILASSRTAPDAAAQIAAGERPRLDYLALADALGADVLDARIIDTLPPWRRRLEHALSSDIAQAGQAWGRRGLYDAWLSMSEKVALPLALRAGRHRRGRTPAHVLIAHNLTSARKRQMHQLTGVLRWGFSAYVCLSSTQERFLRDEVGLPAERVCRINNNVDTRFFRPERGDASRGDYLLAVGRENRDYPTLLAAARILGLPLVIVASSLWAMRGGAVDEAALPPNVTVQREFLPYVALRDLYAGARLVIVPLHEAQYAAGVSGLLEGMAMGRPTVVSHTEGLRDYLTDPATYRAVPPGDAGALAEVVRALWDDAPARLAMASAARTHVETQMSMERYIEGVAAIIRRAAEEGRGD